MKSCFLSFFISCYRYFFIHDAAQFLLVSHIVKWPSATRGEDSCLLPRSGVSSRGPLFSLRDKAVRRAQMRPLNRRFASFKKLCLCRCCRIFSVCFIAAQFARHWAQLLPAICRGCAVRRSGGLSWVSVPVLPASAPALVRAGAPLVALGSPPSVRSTVAGGGLWSW